MPATLGELLQSLYSTLGPTIEQLDEINGIEPRAKAAKIQLEAAVDEYKRVNAQLDVARREVDALKAEAAAKRHLINDEAARVLADTQRQIADRQQELKTLEVQVRDLRAESNNVMQGMQALSKRLRIE